MLGFSSEQRKNFHMKRPAVPQDDAKPQWERISYTAPIKFALTPMRFEETWTSRPQLQCVRASAEGKVQEEELDFCRATGERRPAAG